MVNISEKNKNDFSLCAYIFLGIYVSLLKEAKGEFKQRNAYMK